MPRNAKYRSMPHEVAFKGPPLNIGGIHLEWDGGPKIRDRMRDGLVFFVEGTRKVEDIDACVKNSQLLVPLLSRMQMLDKKPLPQVEELRVELGELLVVNKRKKEENAEIICDTATHLKKLCGFMKMKCRRLEPSFATQQHINIHASIFRIFHV